MSELLSNALGLVMFAYCAAYWQCTVYGYNEPAIPEARLIRG